MNGGELIAQERQRQIDVEGWTLEHDDEHDSGELILAAREYATAALLPNPTDAAVPDNWPWDASWWKPSADPIRNLVRAGALIAAEIDRRGAETWICEECRAPWAYGQSQCGRCGNRTRVVLDG